MRGWWNHGPFEMTILILICRPRFPRGCQSTPGRVQLGRRGAQLFVKLRVHVEAYQAQQAHQHWHSYADEPSR